MKEKILTGKKDVSKVDKRSLKFIQKGRKIAEKKLYKYFIPTTSSYPLVYNPIWQRIKLSNYSAGQVYKL